MSFDVEQLYGLMPALYRLRDADQGEPLKALLGVIAEQIAALEENLDQLYDDQFIETCAEWVVPYIGELVGARGLDARPNLPLSTRAQVANTLGYRRRKGTVVVLEQLAHDVTGWNANAVEFFQLLVATQRLNHLRPNSLATPDLRQWEALEYANTPFDRFAHTVDVRRIGSKRGKYNIPNVGIFLWRIRSYSVTDAPAVAVDSARYRLHTPGTDIALFTAPRTETVFTQLAQPIDVPAPIRPRILNAHRADYYGDGLSLEIMVQGTPVPADKLLLCDLSGPDTGDWGHPPVPDLFALDPTLGRLILPSNAPNAPEVRVSYHYGFSADIGGGEYGRDQTFTAGLLPVEQVPAPNATIQAALNALGGEGVVEITDSGRYLESPTVQATAGNQVEFRAAEEKRAVLVLSQPMQIDGGDEAEVTLNGLWITGASVNVSGSLRRLRLLHCTLTPAAGPALIVTAPNVVIEIEACILGGIQVVETATVQITDSIIDAVQETGVAYTDGSGSGPGAPLTIQDSTVIGKVHAQRLDLASNTIFLAQLAPGDAPVWKAPVWIEERQQGCARFSYVSPDSQTPPKYRCRPAEGDDDARVRPLFTSLRYGDPGYCQLAVGCADEIREGADDQAEMGVFHDLFQPQREANLRARLDEYLRFGLEAGIFYAS